MTWFNIQHKAGVTGVLIYGEIGVFGIGFDEFARELGDAPTVELRIASPGGDSGCALKMARLLGERDTAACFTGPSCSSAITLALGAKRITAHSTARLMVHSPINFCFGSPAELRQQADELEKIVEPIKELYRKRCPAALVDRWFTSGDHYLSATEALTCGLIDEIIEAPILLDREVAAVDATSAPNDSPTEDEAFVNDLLRIVGPIRVRNRERFALELASWFSTVKEL